MLEMREFILIILITAFCFFLAAKQSKKRTKPSTVKGFLYTIDDSNGAENIWQCQRCGESTYTNRKNFDLVEMKKNHR